MNIKTKKESYKNEKIICIVCGREFLGHRNAGICSDLCRKKRNKTHYKPQLKAALTEKKRCKVPAEKHHHSIHCVFCTIRCPHVKPFKGQTKPVGSNKRSRNHNPIDKFSWD